jgi:hypothetical protein
MPVNLTREGPPSAEPVSLEMIKNHLRVSISADDDLIQIYARAARIKVEGYLRRSLVNQSYVQFLDHFPHFPDFAHASRITSTEAHGSRGYIDWSKYGRIKLLRSPLVNVSRITYVDVNSQSVDLFPTFAAWLAKTEFQMGDQIGDPNGNLQEVIGTQETEEDSSSISGGSAPTWPAADASLDVETHDGELTWGKKGQVPTNGGDFIVDRYSQPGRIYPLAGQRWPYTLTVPNAVAIRFRAGYGDDGENVPDNFKVAIMLYTANLYENREPVSSVDLREIPNHLKSLISQDRIIDFAPTGG